MPNGSFMLAIKAGHPNLLSGPHVELYLILSFYMGSILWQYQTHGLFIIFEPDTDAIENTYGKSSFTTGHRKKQT